VTVAQTATSGRASGSDGRCARLLIVGLALLYLVRPAVAQGSRLDRGPAWPTAEQLVRVLLLRDYNTRIVVLGTMCLGMACGAVGTFMLLRKRALISDAISHATLPGIALGFLVMVALGGDGRSLAGLLLAAALSAIVGVGCVLAIRNWTRLKEDAALGIVLSVFFGVGVALLSVIQKMPGARVAGLTSFILGTTASMLWLDAVLIAVTGAVAAVLCFFLFKEFTLLCFDEDFAASQGWSVVTLDVIMMGLVVVVTVVGLQAVGMILVVALLIIPPAAARFWTDRVSTMIWLAAAFGALSGLVGAVLSALFPRLPAGAVVVVAAASVFVVSLLVGLRRGVARRLLEDFSLRRRITSQHLLRALFEWAEPHLAAGVGSDVPSTPLAHLLAARSWTAVSLRRALRRAERKGLIFVEAADRWRLTASGRREGARVTRNHRLWEIYLITHADVAPSHVDRDADMVEHVLGRQMVSQLETLLEAGALRSEPAVVPASPHAMENRS